LVYDDFLFEVVYTYGRSKNKAEIITG